MKKILSALLASLALAVALPSLAQTQPAPPPPPSAPSLSAPEPTGTTPLPPAAPAPSTPAPRSRRILVVPGTPLGPIPPGTPLPPPAPGPAEGRTYTPGPFDSIEISGSADVRFTQGPSDLVIIRGDEEVQRAIVLDVRDGRLRIDQGGAWRFWDPNRVRIEVQSRDLARVTISGAGDFVAPSPVRADKLLVNISGAGSARFERLDAQKLSFQIAGKGDGQVSGTTRELIVKISGHGEFRGENLRSDLCEVQVSGVGNARIWTVEQLRLAVAGIGKIDYWGKPQVERRISGAATINERGPKP